MKSARLFFRQASRATASAAPRSSHSISEKVCGPASLTAASSFFVTSARSTSAQPFSFTSTRFLWFERVVGLEHGNRTRFGPKSYSGEQAQAPPRAERCELRPIASSVPVQDLRKSQSSHAQRRDRTCESRAWPGAFLQEVEVVVNFLCGPLACGDH